MTPTPSSESWPGCMLSSCKPTPPSSLCLLAVPHPTPRLSLQISPFCSLVPLAYFWVPSQIAASFSPPSSIYPHCSCGTFPVKLFLSAHFQQSATRPRIPDPHSFCWPRLSPWPLLLWTQDAFPLFVLLIISLPSWALHSIQEETLCDLSTA